jgi:hypothetical protein
MVTPMCLHVDSHIRDKRRSKECQDIPSFHLKELQAIRVQGFLCVAACSSRRGTGCAAYASFETESTASDNELAAHICSGPAPIGCAVYQGLLLGLEAAYYADLHSIEIWTDNEVVCRQV